MKKTMSHTLLHVFALGICLALCILFGFVLFVYTVPMQDVSYDLSLMWEGEAPPEDWQYDQKGWTVFTQEEEQQTILTADGMGGFTGLQKPGQTFYFSRMLTEALDSPTLRLDASNHGMAVFLDGELLYTDCPELDNRIGYLTLPMLDWDRIEYIVLSLPPDYHGKTLTVAQATSPGEQKPQADPFVWPCSAWLYCGYSYESGLIAESFQTAILAALCFGAGVLLLSAFLWQLFSGKSDWSLPFLALTTFLWSAEQIAMSGFTYHYFGSLPVDVARLFRLCSFTVLLLFLTSRLTGKSRIFFAALTALQGILTLPAAMPDINSLVGFWYQSIPEWIGVFGLVGVFACMGWEWKRKHLFSRFFCPVVLAALAVSMTWILAVPALRREVGQQLVLGAHGYFIWRLMGLMMAAAVFAALMEWVMEEITHRAETKVLAQQYEIAQAGFENLRRHQEEVMMLRHDMKKHLTFLRQSISDKGAAQYLDSLIGQQQTLSPVVQSRNQALDIILSAKLGEAAGKGIEVEVVQADAPKSLPLSDAELCALMMNLLDNAIHAAGKTEKPFLRLDMHQKDGFFVFVCENAAMPEPLEKSTEKKTAAQHGLGMKIMEQIITRHGNLMEVERLSGSYRVTVALPLVTLSNNA